MRAPLRTFAALGESGRGQLGLPIAEPVPDPDALVDKFQRDLHAVCRHHGMTIYPDTGEALVVERLGRGETNEHILESLVGSSIDEGEG